MTLPPRSTCQVACVQTHTQPDWPLVARQAPITKTVGLEATFHASLSQNGDGFRLWWLLWVGCLVVWLFGWLLCCCVVGCLGCWLVAGLGCWVGCWVGLVWVGMVWCGVGWCGLGWVGLGSCGCGCGCCSLLGCWAVGVDGFLASCGCGCVCGCCSVVVLVCCGLLRLFLTRLDVAQSLCGQGLDVARSLVLIRSPVADWHSVPTNLLPTTMLKAATRRHSVIPP